MFPALIISLGSIFYPLAPKNYCPMHEPSCSYILFHISLFSTGGHMKTICLKSLPVLVFHLFLCEINRILLDFVVNPSCTPINICKSLWGSSMSHPNSIEKTLLFVAETRVANGRSYQKFMQDLCALLHNQGRHCLGLCTNSCLITSENMNAISFPFSGKKKSLKFA